MGWYRLDADQGDAEARYNLAVLYATGRGVPQDDVQASLWLNLGSSRMTREDRESAVKSRDVVAERLTPEQIAEAQRIAAEWDTAHPRN